MASQPAITPRQPTGFLHLPAEIRNAIYTLYFSTEGELTEPATAKHKQRTPQYHGHYHPRLVPWISCTASSSRRKYTYGRDSFAVRLCQPDKDDPSSVYCGTYEAWDLGHVHAYPIVPPAIARASGQVRGETLPMFYAANLFLVYLSQTTPGTLEDSGVISWLRGLGTENAAELRNLVIVYRKKYLQRGVEERLLELMKAEGVKMDEASVRWNRIEGASKLTEGGDVYVMRLKREKQVRQTNEVSRWSGEDKYVAL